MRWAVANGVRNGLATAVMCAVALGCKGGATVRPPASDEGKPTTSAAVALPELAEAHEVFLQPPAEQVLYLRQWAEDFDSKRGQGALRHLAWRRDEQTSALARGALKSRQAATRALAARVLAHLGPKAAGAEALAVLKLADISSDHARASAPAIVWARVVLGDRSVLPAALAGVADGTLKSVTRLGGGSAFSEGRLASVMTPAEARAQATDESPIVRAAAAWVLGEHAVASDAGLLAKLTTDPEQAVVLAAVGAIARIDSGQARNAIRDALVAAGADAEWREQLIATLAQSGGGPALVTALDVQTDEGEAKVWFRTQQVLRRLRQMADPRAAKPLLAWTPPDPAAHWKGMAGIAIAELGDVRAAPLLAARLKEAPSDIYPREKFWQADAGGHLSKTDHLRVFAVRLLADLAELHPGQKAALAKVARGPVSAWLDQRSAPHAAGMRVLSRLGGAEDVARLRKWAFPADPLPAVGDSPPFPRAYEVAQSALRYVGASRDGTSFDGLVAQLHRKTDPALNITQEGLEGAGVAMLGMALRAVGYGAAHGLSEWGAEVDPRAFGELSAFVEDKTWHEEARLAACAAIPWIASDAQLTTVVGKIGRLGQSADEADRFIAECYAAGLADHPPPALVGSLIALLTPAYDEALRLQVGRAIGSAGLGAATPADKRALQDALEARETRTAAAVAWLLGGSQDEARRTIAQFGEPGWAATLEPVKDAWYRALGYWSAADAALDNVHRWVANAEAIAQVELTREAQRWALARLMSQLGNVVYDNGPHSLTRVVLQHRLVAQAKAKRLSAVRVLAAMKAEGALLALSGEAGEVGGAARNAFYELLNPVPESSAAE